MTISVQHRIYIAIAVLIGTCGGLSFFVLYPSMTEIMQTANEMAETRLGIEKKYLSGQYLRRANQDIEKVQSVVADLVKIFIPKEEEYIFLTQFEEKMTALGYQITDIDLSVLEKQKVGLSDVLRLTFSIGGDFPTLIKALESLRTIDPIITIDQIQFQPKIAKDPLTQVETKSLTMAVTARVYRVDPQKIQIFADDSETISTP